MMTGGGWSFHSGVRFHGARLLVCWFLRGMVGGWSGVAFAPLLWAFNPRTYVRG